MRLSTLSSYTRVVLLYSLRELLVSAFASSHTTLPSSLASRIRTCGPSVPNRVLYRTELQPDKKGRKKSPNFNRCYVMELNFDIYPIM